MSGALFFANDPEYREALREPFPPEQIGKLPKAGMQLDFVGHAAVTDRLNTVAPDWTYEVEPVVVQGKDGMPHVLAMPGRMTIGGKTLPECGEVDRASTYGDEYKRGISDFIRRGAMRFGVALDLWSREDLRVSGGDVPPAVAHGTAPSSPEHIVGGADEPGRGVRDPSVEGSPDISSAGTPGPTHERESSGTAVQGPSRATDVQWQRAVSLFGSRSKVMDEFHRTFQPASGSVALRDVTSDQLAVLIKAKAGA